MFVHWKNNNLSPAWTGKAARRIQANVFTAAVTNRAFVDVFAMRSKTRLLVTIVAYALVGAHHVLANAIRAYTTSSRALVNILTGLLVRPQFMSWRTLTIETSFGIDADSTATQSWRLFALVYVWNVWQLRNYLQIQRYYVKFLN